MTVLFVVYSTVNRMDVTKAIKAQNICFESMFCRAVSFLL
jgi:hypothetical protein